MNMVKAMFFLYSDAWVFPHCQTECEQYALARFEGESVSIGDD